MRSLPATGSCPSRPAARGLLATRVLDARMTHYIRARACMACARLEVARCSQLQSQIPSRPKELARRRPDDGIFLAGKCLSIDCCSKLSSPSSSLKPAAVHAPGRRATRTLSTRFDYATTQVKHHSTEGVLHPFTKSSPSLQGSIEQACQIRERSPRRLGE